LISAASVQKNPQNSPFLNKPFTLKLFAILKLMLFATPVFAQKKSELTLQWKVANELPAETGKAVSIGVAGPVTGVYKDRFIVAGGANFPGGMPWEGGAKKYHDQVYIYSQDRRKLKLQSATDTLPRPVAYAASCSINDGLLYAGGENESGFSEQVWLIAFETDGKIRFTALPSLPEPVSNASIALLGHTVYLAGGENNSQAFASLLALDLNYRVAGWKKLADIPQPVSHAVLTAGSNQTGDYLYLSGGRKKNSNGISTIYHSLWVYDIKRNNWTGKAALPYALCAGTGIQSDGNTILLFGGDRGLVFNKAETLIAAINAETDPVKKQELIREKNQLQSTHPGFSREILKYTIENDSWSSVAEIPYDTPVTCTAVKGNHGILIASGEIRAGVRSPKILSLKIRHKRP